MCSHGPPHDRLLLRALLAFAAGLQLLPVDPAIAATPHPVAPPSPVPTTGKSAEDQASQLVVPLQPDLDFVPKVDPDPQRGPAIRGLVRWRLPPQP